ncbi:hypothetical protein CHS0354_013350 [Potamilus streckersoni]|uniref:Tyrosine-protein kinase n=1 Tax=Potamilus streckersoni TaxID=2493646 RepID=A0AAE0W5K6_9BIVA|nr:hypothetical protein CHS0354_013350 [Potamilus streckersoni]
MNEATSVQKKKEVSLDSMPWFHGKIERPKSEELLHPRQNGLFLIRESVNFPGDYTLSVCFENKVEHYRIYYRNNQFTIDEEGYFDNLVKLVEHYQNDADGLCTNLLKPLQNKKKEFQGANIQFKSCGWEIKLKDLLMGEVIGEGEFGVVHKGVYKDMHVAIKSLRDKNKAAQQFLEEASLMTSLRHPNLVSLIGVVLGDTIRLVTEYMGKGNLVDYLRSRGRNHVTKIDQINYATDTCSGMAYLEGKNVVHRDLAARNVLVNDQGTAKVSDFGLARHEDYSQESDKIPIKWTAPEALKEKIFTSKSDMWSFGILLWEIYSFGRVPYPRIPVKDVKMHVERGYRMEAPEACPKDIYEIMLETWKLKPNERPSFEVVLKKLHKLQSTTV